MDTVVLAYISNDPTFENDALGHDEKPSGFQRATNAVYSHSYVAWAVADLIKRVLLRGARNDTFALPTAAEVAYSMTAVDSMKALCAGHGCGLLVALYRDNAIYAKPAAAIAYEGLIGEALSAHTVPWSLVHSYSDHLSWREARVTWNDGHSSPRATSYIVSDLLRMLGH